MSAPDQNSIVMAHLGRLEGQLSTMTQLMQQHHDSTNQRINDLLQAVERRIDNVEARVDRVEKRVDGVEDKERSNAIKSAGGGAFSGAIAAAMVELIKFLSSR